MMGLFNLVGIALGLLIFVIPFIDKVVLRPVHRERLQSTFETWWKEVQNYDHLKLALRCAEWANGLMDGFFGTKLLSKKVIFRCTLFASGVLIITLSWVGLVDGQPFGVTPWKNYSDSIKAAVGVMDSFISEYDVMVYASIDISNAPPFNITTNALIENKIQNMPLHIVTNELYVTIGTNSCLVTIKRNAKVSISQIAPLGHGDIIMLYDRRFDFDQTTNVSTNLFGNVIGSTNPFIELKNDAIKVKCYVKEHDKTRYIVAYSFAYFILLFAVNIVLFIVSLAFCRITLREIILSKRILSAIALVTIEIVTFIIFAIVLLLFMTLLAMPFLWLLFPLAYYIAEHSLYTFCAYLFAGTMSIWLLSGVSSKVVALIALNCTVT